MAAENDLGQRIAAWREHRGMSQAVLAKRIELTPGAVGNWEVGTDIPTGRNLQRVIEVLGITMQQLWGRIPARKRKAS